MGVAHAQPAAEVSAEREPSASSSRRPTQLGYGAMPGGLHAPNATTLPKGTVAVATLGGWGYRSDLLGPDHSFFRYVGTLAVAFAPLAELTLGLSLDGRADQHYGLEGQDDGYVGDPRLVVRYGKPVGRNTFGGQLTLWAPGRDAPSIAGSAISVDAKALASLAVGPGTLGVSAGFRLDNSFGSVDPAFFATLSVQDKVSLGVSDYHAATAGLSYTLPVGTKGFFTAEASTDIFVGSGAPGPLFRFGASGGVHVTQQWSVLAFLEGAKVPGLNLSDIAMNDIVIIPYEPIVTAGLGLQARFGGPKRRGSVVENDRPQVIEVVEYASVSGRVLDDAGKPVVGATVTVKLTNHTGTDATDETGTFTVDQLPVGKTISGTTALDDTAAQISVAVDGKKPAAQTRTLVQGANRLPDLTLESMLPPGQLRAVVRAAGTGKPVPGAVVTIEPGGQTATAGPDGTITLDLPPGTYKATATAGGFKTQILDVVIEENGVSVKNFELGK